LKNRLLGTKAQPDSLATMPTENDSASVVISNNEMFIVSNSGLIFFLIKKKKYWKIN